MAAPERTFVPRSLDEVFSVDRGSGRYHVRLRDERGRYWALEQCERSRAGAWAEVAEVPASTPRALLCQWCFFWPLP